MTPKVGYRRFIWIASVLPAGVILVGMTAPSWPGQLCCHWSFHCALLLTPLLALVRSGPVQSFLVMAAMLIGSYRWINAAFEPRAAQVESSGLTVVTANVAAWNARRNTAITAATDLASDILCLVEVTPSDHEFLSKDARWPNQVWVEQSAGLALLSRIPIARSERTMLFGQPIIDAELMIQGQPLRVIAVHTLSPMLPHRQYDRDAYLAAIGTKLHNDSRAALILGDFNLSVGDPRWRDFRFQSGLLRPAGHEPATWPSYVGPFGITIDHVVGKGICLDTPYAFNLPGSDHRGLMTRLSMINTLNVK